ncbi:amidohydrolase family protein, partial [candidate division WOR-3 bacterium]|nr:amidohydrolase family protein [candidate division WOR-3 bacterium]
VPASEFESPGAGFDIELMKLLFRKPDVIGVAEMMNFPGVLGEDRDIWNKLGLSTHIDGHIPGITDKRLQAYVSAGIRNDHESTTAAEAREKMARGMFVFIREGSAARNLEATLPAVDALTWRRAAFCTDDISAADLIERGSIDFIVKQALKKGLSLEKALIMASWNAAKAHGLSNLGAIAPGYLADILVLEPETLAVKTVLKRGKPIDEDYQFKDETRETSIPAGLLKTVHLPALSENSLRIPNYEKVRVIGLIDSEILTTEERESPKTSQGFSDANIDNDLLKAAVIERHGKSGKVGLGFVKGFGLKKGAMASTVAHDAHNLVVVGTKDSDMISAARKVADMNGGQVLVSEGKTLASLPLPVAGLMTGVGAEDVSESIRKLKTEARELGSGLSDPFAALSFLALSVIPQLRLTTHGILDVEQWKIVEVKG